MSNRRASTAVAAVGVILFVAVQNYVTAAASAEKHDTVTLKTMSPDDLKKKCDAAGGTFENYVSDWTCPTDKGVVACNSKQCTGVTTAASAPAPKQVRDPQTIPETFSAQ